MDDERRLAYLLGYQRGYETATLVLMAQWQRGYNKTVSAALVSNSVASSVTSDTMTPPAVPAAIATVSETVSDTADDARDVQCRNRKTNSTMRRGEQRKLQLAQQAEEREAIAKVQNWKDLDRCRMLKAECLD